MATTIAKPVSTNRLDTATPLARIMPLRRRNVTDRGRLPSEQTMRVRALVHVCLEPLRTMFVVMGPRNSFTDSNALAVAAAI